MQATEKKLKIFYVGPQRYSHLSVLELHGQAWINLNFFGGCDINFLSFWCFMRRPCFSSKKVSKRSFSLSQQKNSPEIKPWLFCCWKMKNATFETFFFQWLAYIKYEWFLQELEMACVFAIKISISIVWRCLHNGFYSNCYGCCFDSLYLHCITQYYA